MVNQIEVDKIITDINKKETPEQQAWAWFVKIAHKLDKEMVDDFHKIFGNKSASDISFTAQDTVIPSPEFVAGTGGVNQV